MTLIVKPGFNGMTDADAIAYVNAVEAADGQLLEFGVGKAINDFVVGCKLDNTWSAIKASCILSGARTLAGALVPLVGTAPTNVGGLFVSGDYNRKTGLVGDGSTKYLNSNRNNNADPQNNNHNVVYIGQVPTSAFVNHVFIGVGPVTNETGANNLGYSFSAPANRYFFRNRSSTDSAINAVTAIGLFGASRNASASYIRRFSGSSTSVTTASQTPLNASIIVFATENGNLKTNARLSFYSIGESLDLALLDARVSALITAFGVAIP